MSKTVRLRFNAQEIDVPEGTYLIEAAKKAGVEVPHFCYHPKLKYDANCRMCLVEVEKMPKLQTSCSTLATEGMVVVSDTPRVKAAQEGVMAFLLGNHPLDCPECDQGGECQLQDFAHQHSPRVGQFTEEKRVFPKEYFGPLIEKEMNRCVSCLRCVRYCDEIMDVNALGSIDRGSRTQIGGFDHHALDCEFCGGCIQICPVGALTSRLSMYHYRPWQVKKTETICNYCADGCQMTIETIDNQVIRTSSKLGQGRNMGDLCARGFFGYGFIHHPDRLTRPTLRLPGRSPLSVTWESALNRAASTLSEIKEKYGAGAIGGIISAHATNEELYLFQKLMREVIGTPHIDSTVRYGDINAARGLQSVFGTMRLASYEEVSDADVLLVFASEMTETHPIVALRVKEAVNKRGATLITLGTCSTETDFYRSHLPKRAALHLQVTPEGCGMAIQGLLKALAGIASVSSYVDKMRQATETISWETIETATGVSEALYKQAAMLCASAKRGLLIFGREVTHAPDGYLNVMRLADLSLLAGEAAAGQAETFSSFGLLTLLDANNAYGAMEMGAVAEYLPGWIPAPTPGDTLIQMLEAARSGTLKALYIVGENPLRALPQAGLREAMGALELLICQDMFPSDLTAMAHIVFPAASYAEKSGRFTNQEGEIQPVRAAIEPVGLSKSDGTIFTMLAKRLGASWTYANPNGIWKEAVMALPATTWPSPSKEVMRSRVRAYQAAPFSASCDTASKIPSDPTGGRFFLQVGQLLFHAGRTSTYAAGLNLLDSTDAIWMHPDDAAHLQVAQDNIVEISGQGQSVCLPVRLSRKRARGTLFYPEHFSGACKILLPLTQDPITHVPYGDRGWVRVIKKQ